MNEIRTLAQFEKKVRSMKASEIIQAMIDGLNREWTVINMGVFGVKDGTICYGCAATNAICEIIQQNYVFKWDFVEPNANTFFRAFEYAINLLRQAVPGVYQYNTIARDKKFAIMPEKYCANIELPSLSTFNWKKMIFHYQALADALKKDGL